MATIQKRNDSYLIRVSCGYDTQGKQIIKSRTWKPEAGMTERQIEKELNRITVEFESLVENGDYTNVSNIKLSEFTVQYLQLVKNSIAPTTYSIYERTIRQIVIPSLGHMKLKDIKPLHVQRFIQVLSEEGIRKDGKEQPLSPSSIQRYFVVLKSIMAKAYKLGLIGSNPTDTAKLELPTVEEPEVEIFTQEEASHMLSCLENEPLTYRLIIHLAIITGCRRGELMGLKWENVKFPSNSLEVKQSNYKLTGEDIKTKVPKTQKSIRTVSIPDYCMDLLREYRKEQTVSQMELGDQWINEGWVFTQWNGKPMHPHTPTHWFTKFLKRYDIPHRKFHALRHTSATLLLANGTNIKTVASRLGHTQLATTNRYLHALEEADKKAADSFETILFQGKTDKKFETKNK